MKSEYFLALPLLATAFNVLFASLLNFSHSHAQPLGNEGVIERCVESSGQECVVSLEDSLTKDMQALLQQMEEEKAAKEEAVQEEDPMLKQMPGIDFKAYVRADIATFYQQEPGSRIEQKPKFNGQACKFVNISPDPVTAWWVGPDGPLLNGNIDAWASGGTACFPGHEFIFSQPDQPDDVICRINIVEGTSVYYCDPFEEDSNADERPDRGFRYVEKRTLDTLTEEDLEQYKAHRFNLEFGALYKNFTGGSEWLTMYPKDPPLHKIWRADYFGQLHQVVSTESQFHTMPPASELHKLTREQMSRNVTKAVALQQYREPGDLNLTLKAISCAPRAFEIRNFLSDVEVEHVLDIVRKKHMERSTTAGHTSDTRTSTTTWLQRNTDAIMDAIIRRAADALRLNEALLRDRAPGEVPEYETLGRINEDLQIVHYAKGQQYTAHHDFGYPDGEPGSPSRSINLCMYLNDVPAGGQTSFPRWRNAETSASIDVKPEKGKAMIFYMVNPDGNLDDLTQHAALPVLEGEKFFANLWIHDPYRS